jgi:hypothetical protein
VYVAPDRLTYETLAICRTLALTRAAFELAIAEKAGRPVHDPQPDARGEAAPGGRLVRAARRTRPSTAVDKLTTQN